MSCASSFGLSSAGPDQGPCVHDAWQFMPDLGDLPTWTPDNPLTDRQLGPPARIDHVLVEAPESVNGSGCPVHVDRFGRPIAESWPSDHVGVVATFEYFVDVE
jgi:hypothetical protein